jgi:hypothetical protein
MRATILALALWTATVPLPAQNLTGVKAIVDQRDIREVREP